jgi:hypothetical protein
VEDFTDEPCTKELHDLLTNRLALLVVEAAKALFHRFRSQVDVQLVLDNLSWDPLHVGGFPCKHIEVRFEEGDERAFLFRIDLRPDTERVAVVGDDRILDILGRLERAGCTLGRLRDIMVLGARLGVEPLGPDDCLSELKGFNVTLECALVCWPYCDDPLRSRIFSFRYIWLGTAINFAYAGLPRIAWYVPENPITLNVRVYVRKFRISPNVTGRSICPRGSALISSTTPWNGPVDGLRADRGMPISSSIDA